MSHTAGIDESRYRYQVSALVLATLASQALLVVLGPTIVAISADLDAPMGATGQARTITTGPTHALDRQIPWRGHSYRLRASQRS